MKRTKWCKEEVQKAVAAKKVAYRRMLEVETEEARQRYVEAKREAKKVVRRAKNEEWNDFGRELEADTQGKQKRFWSRLRSLGGSYRNARDARECRLMCSNYRGVSLLSVAGKWFGKVLNTKLRDCTERRDMEKQGGFRAKRSCVDQVFTLRQVMEKAIEKRRELFVAFIDLEKAYDRVNRVKLWETLRQAQVGEGLVRAVQSLYMECEARVKVGKKQSEWFNVDQGVRQGSTLSPWLFNVFLDTIVKEAREGFVEGVRLGNEIVDVLLVADDMVLVADSEESLQINLKKLDETLTR